MILSYCHIVIIVTIQNNMQQYCQFYCLISRQYCHYLSDHCHLYCCGLLLVLSFIVTCIVLYPHHCPARCPCSIVACSLAIAAASVPSDSAWPAARLNRSRPKSLFALYFSNQAVPARPRPWPSRAVRLGWACGAAHRVR